MNETLAPAESVPVVVAPDNAEKTNEKAADRTGRKAKKPVDDHILVLKKPLLIGERTVKQLNLDCSQLTGADFRELASEYRLRTNNPNVMNLIYDEAFRLTVIARINEIPYEDLDQLSFGDSVKATSRVIFFFVE